MRKQFLRKDAHKKKRVAQVWRKPKGIQNKRRLQRKGHSGIVKPGYMKPMEAEIVLVSSVKQLSSLDPKMHSVVIAKVSRKSKMKIIEEAEKMKFRIINLNVKKYSERTEELFKEKKEAEMKLKERETKKKEAEKEASKKKEEKKEELTDEEKKKQEKEEKDKILITKGS